MAKYAIIKSGSKQYQVSPGDVIDVDLLEGDKGSQIQLQNVLFIQNDNESTIGFPIIDGAVVRAEVIAQVRGPKVFAYKYKQRKRSTRRKVGHRQSYTRLKITEV